MKPTPTFEIIDLDWLVLYICPDVWDEKKPFRFRGFAMVILYTLSCIFWFSCLQLGLFLVTGTYGSLYIRYLVVISFGVVLGLAAYSDFKKREKQEKEQIADIKD